MSQEPKPSVGRESDKFMLRFPDGMRDRIAELAKQNGRSMNAEIIARLEASFEAEPRTISSEVVTTSFDERLTATVREAIESVLTPEAIDAMFKPRPLQFVIENPDGTVTVIEPKSYTKIREPIVNISGGISSDDPKRPERIVRRATSKKTTEK